jgi:hypothetical protein
MKRLFIIAIALGWLAACGGVEDDANDAPNNAAQNGSDPREASVTGNLTGVANIPQSATPNKLLNPINTTNGAGGNDAPSQDPMPATASNNYGCLPGRPCARH